MIKYQAENRNDIIQTVEIDLTGISAQSKEDLKHKIAECLRYKDKKIFKFEAGNKLVYETEVLIPKINKERLNLLLVVGNPAVHSVAEGMFFSYEKTRSEGKWREHRFWKALRDCEILKFYKDLGKPTPENNEYKREHLLNGEYENGFNIFLLTYFSFPTPASGPYSGVNGIRKIFGKEIKEIFEEMKKFEFKRFKEIVLRDDIRNVICCQKTAREEIIEKARGDSIYNILNNSHYPAYNLDDDLKSVTLYTAPPTKDFYKVKAKETLKGIVADIKDKNNIG